MRQNGVPDAYTTPYFRETTPCENGLFATDGQIISREGSHNVKKHADFFTFPFEKTCTNKTQLMG